MRSLLFGIGLAVLVSGAGPVVAQDLTLPGLDGDANPLAHSGSGVFHGNYCGIGDRGPGRPPVDALDEACMHHDACTRAGRLPSCACNARFEQETRWVAEDEDQPDDLRALAETVGAGISMLPCH